MSKPHRLQESMRSERIKDFCVVGAGLPRTGTTSLTEALNLLGLGPCYHMSEVIRFSQQHVWKSVADLKAQGKKIDWDRVFSGKSIPSYRSGVDFPMSAYYQELLQYYPNSKVILTVREPEKWYDSFNQTVARVSRHHPERNCFFGCVTCPTPHSYMDQWVESPIPKMFFGEEALSSKETAIKAYNEWTEQVKRNVPEEKLLIFHPRNGWEPLCKFLEVPVPDEPFPRSNTRKDMSRRECCIVFVGIIQIILFPLLIIQWVVFWWKDGFRDVEERDVDEGITINIEQTPSKTKPYLKLTLKAGEKLGITFNSNSCGVQSVEADSVAHFAGVKNGWVISKVDGKTVTNDNECKSAITSGLQINSQCEITFNKAEINVEMKNYEVKNYVPGDID